MINERVITGFVILFFILVMTPEIANSAYERLGFIGYGVPALIAVVLAEAVVWLRRRIRSRRKRPDF